MESDFPEFDKAYNTILLPENPDKFDLLAAQARFNIYHHDLWHGTGRRFAELIVRECMKVADEGMAQVTMKVEWPSYHIKKHFGVE